ncbi:hypothetical protein DQM28_00070 [Leptospira mayottensis]|uniref:Uncharacterized protein n=1 Tax=Leptospira mayottensis TaxID=1137606 RepID=A0ABM6Y508_9LEPT|nr:hypothetical protein DQM28_00070 [Leptospira mayottensis]
MNSKRKASHTPALIHCAPNVEPLNLKSNDLWTIPSKDDSDGNIGAEGGVIPPATGISSIRNQELKIFNFLGFLIMKNLYFV